MALPNGSYERLRSTDRADEVAYIQACLRLYIAGPGVAGGVSMPGLGGGDIARLNKVTSFVLTVVEHRAVAAVAAVAAATNSAMGTVRPRRSAIWPRPAGQRPPTSAAASLNGQAVAE